MEDQRLSPREAAAYIAREWHLKVSPSTVRRWIEKRAVPAQRTTAGRILIHPADLHAIFDAPPATTHND